MSEHKLIANTLNRETDGIIARCECGWVSRGHFSSMAGAAAMMDHREKCAASRRSQEEGDGT